MTCRMISRDSVSSSSFRRKECGIAKGMLLDSLPDVVIEGGVLEAGRKDTPRIDFVQQRLIGLDLQIVHATRHKFFFSLLLAHGKAPVFGLFP